MTAITFKNQYNSYSYSGTNQAEKMAKVVEPKAMAAKQESAVAELLAPKTEVKSFLETAKEALIYQRLGVDKEKIDELKAAIKELAKKLEEQGADSNIIKAKVDELQSMLAQEYQKGRERLAAIPEHDKGKIISALV